MKDKTLIPNLLFGSPKLDLKVWINLNLKPGQPENIAMFKLFPLQLAEVCGVSFPEPCHLLSVPFCSPHFQDVVTFYPTAFSSQCVSTTALCRPVLHTRRYTQQSSLQTYSWRAVTEHAFAQSFGLCILCNMFWEVVMIRDTSAGDGSQKPRWGLAGFRGQHLFSKAKSLGGCVPLPGWPWGQAVVCVSSCGGCTQDSGQPGRRDGFSLWPALELLTSVSLLAQAMAVARARISAASAAALSRSPWDGQGHQRRAHTAACPA